MTWDGFSVVEQEMRALVADPRWPRLPIMVRTRSVVERMLVTPDGSRWMYGAHARWYRLDRVDARWHLSAPPRLTSARQGAVPAPPDRPPPQTLVPTGPDFIYDRGSTQAFVGPDVPRAVTEPVRGLLRTYKGLPRQDFPLTAFRDVFASDVPSTVAAVWGTIMWCAYAPAFDGNEALLSMFGEFLARPLPGDDWVRWLPAVSLDTLIGLYTERMRAGAADAGLRLAGLMIETADVLRADQRFRPRAEALFAMAAPLRAQPWADHHAIAGGAVRQAWLARCPAHLSPATLADVSPGEHFRHVLYDLVESLGYLAERGADPRAVAASLLGADLAATSSDLVTLLYPWIDDELRHALYIALADSGHPLRGCWPVEGELPHAMAAPDRAGAAAVLGASYATALAWCRLTGSLRPSHGFPVSSALVPTIIHERDDPPTGPVPPPPGVNVVDTPSDWLYKA
ncbi:hypothetical protein J5X84_43325 [Streptosporangiaceae bacterium NEAU-GS5]|nr:hypothetical protein [Streptosporangiaceae bacterium NEAU-GS5]